MTDRNPEPLTTAPSSRQGPTNHENCITFPQRPSPRTKTNPSPIRAFNRNTNTNTKDNSKHKSKDKDKRGGDMDMSKFVPRWINNTALRRLGGRYEGIIERVVEQTLNNRYKGEKQPEPVIVFADGYRLVPNIAMRRLLMERLGRETDLWAGEPLVIECRSTGTGRETKHLLFPDDRGDTEDQPTRVTKDEPDFDDPIGAHDEDEIEAEARPFAWRRR